MAKQEATEVQPDTKHEIGSTEERGTSAMDNVKFYEDKEPLVPENEAFEANRTVERTEGVLEPSTKSE